MKTCIFVLIPPDAPDFSAKMDALLAPYSYHHEVEPYQTECWCIQSRAQSEVSDRVLARLGTMPEIEARLTHLGLSEAQNQRFNALREKKGIGDPRTTDRLTQAEKQEFDQLADVNWRPSQEASRLWGEEERREWADNPPVLRPELDCSECGGSGTMTTDDNPDGHFDSCFLCYDLEVPQYDPALDENNRLSCLKPPEQGCALEEQPDEVSLAAFLSLPVRTFRAVRNAMRAALPSRCEGCLADGQRLRWARDWKENRKSMLPVSWIDHCHFLPSAVVTPDGRWHDLDLPSFGWAEADLKRMGDEAVTKFERLMEAHADCTLAACWARL